MNIVPITAMMVKHNAIKFRIRRLNGGTVAQARKITSLPTRTVAQANFARRK